MKLNVVHCYPSEDSLRGFIKWTSQAGLCQPPLNACNFFSSILQRTEVPYC